MTEHCAVHLQDIANSARTATAALQWCCATRRRVRHLPAFIRTGGDGDIRGIGCVKNTGGDRDIRGVGCVKDTEGDGDIRG